MTDIKVRELRSAFRHDKMQEMGGGLLIKDVKLLATGTWTDSKENTALYYPPSALEKFAGNWKDSSLWARHSGGVPRSINDKIGEVRNQHYRDGAVVGDLWLHGKTQNSRDAIELIKAGIANYVSVEHGGTEVYNRATGRYEAESLTFSGVAVVNRGACKPCTINNESELSLSGTNFEGDNNMTTELELQNEIYELKRQLQEAHQRILNLEKTPVTATQRIVEQELEEPLLRVFVDKKRGEVWGDRWTTDEFLNRK
jgi:hypothetical protein